jgi:F-type H+-transporting ATPase subunit a
MKSNPFVHEVVWQFGPVGITQAVITTWALMAALAALAWWLRRRLCATQPGAAQLLAEWALETLQTEMRATMNTDPAPFLPVIATLFIFILSGNLCSLIPGVEPPTGALETDLALALAVFFAVLGWGIRRHGLWGYLKTYGEPSLMMLPLNLLEAVTRVVSMTVRLFGNIMSGMFISAVVLGLAGLLVPVPFMALELLTGLIQAYIFTVLAMVFVAAAAGDHND